MNIPSEVVKNILRAVSIGLKINLFYKIYNLKKENIFETCFCWTSKRLTWLLRDHVNDVQEVLQEKFEWNIFIKMYNFKFV